MSKTKFKLPQGFDEFNCILEANDSPISCGVKDIQNVSMLENECIIYESLFMLMDKDNPHNGNFRTWKTDELPAFAIYSDTTDSGGCDTLTKFILKNKLGTVVKTRNVNNPNTDNEIVVHIWKINHAKCDAWINKIRKAIRERDKDTDPDDDWGY